MIDRLHRDRVAHLLMEPRVGFRRRQAVRCEQRRGIEIDGRIGGIARRIDVDHLDVFADRTRLEVIFPGHLNRHATHARKVVRAASAGSKEKMRRRRTSGRG